MVGIFLSDVLISHGGVGFEHLRQGYGYIVATYHYAEDLVEDGYDIFYNPHAVRSAAR